LVQSEELTHARDSKMTKTIKIKSKKKLIISILVFPIILIFGYFAFTLFMYQYLVNRGSVLADNQCLKVNPLIIERKNSYIREIEAAKANNSDEYFKEMDNYYAISRKFVTAQTAWLDAQKAYMDRWDFQYFIPEYMKEAARTQFVARDADRKSTQYLIDSYEIYQLNEAIAQDLGNKAMEQIKIRNDAEKKYDEIFDAPRKLDWRTRFIKVPASKCPDENFDIPNVDDFLYPNTAPKNTNSPLS